MSDITGPTFDGQEIIDDTLSFLDQIPPGQIKEMLDAVNTELEQFRDVERTYFVLGNYDKYPKRRVERVRDELADGREGSVSFLLDEVDPDETIWKNFYVKFRVLLRRADYVVLVAEDNDGGHELEVGEVPNEKLYVLKRDYDGASLDPPTAGRSARSPKYGDIDHDRSTRCSSRCSRFSNRRNDCSRGVISRSWMTVSRRSCPRPSPECVVERTKSSSGSAHTSTVSA